MTIQQAYRNKDTHNGRFSLQDGANLSLSYTAISDDWNDTPVAVAAYFASNADLPYLGDSWQFGNDTLIEAVCQDFYPVVDPGSKPPYIKWNVTLSFWPLTKDEVQPDDGGRPSTDPSDFAPEYGIYFAERTVDMVQAYFEGVYKDGQDPAANGTLKDLPYGGLDGGPPRSIGTLGPVTNSAFEVFDPPFSGLRADAVIMVRNWQPAFLGSWMPFYNRINSAALELIDLPRGIDFSGDDKFPKWTLRVANIASETRFIKNRWWHEMGWTFQYREGGWIEDLADVGRHAWAGGGAVKPGGGVWSFTAGERLRPCNLRIIHQVDPLTGQQLPVVDPVRLNGAGQPVDKDDGCKEAYWLRYRQHLTANLLQLPVGFSVP